MKTIDIMPYKIIYVDKATQDVKEAKAWYKKQRQGLQKQFATAIIEAISRLQKTPTAYAVRYKNIRVIHTKTFPFGIHFYIEESGKQIVITAIMHDYRDIALIEERV